MKLSQSFHVHGIAPSRNRTKAPRSPVPRHANFSNTLSDAPRFRGRPFPRGHSRSAMKLSQIFRVHGIAPSRNRTKAPHSPAPVNFSNMLSSAFADGPFPRRHTRITKSHPESSAGSAHAPASPCHADRSRAVSLSLASLSRVPHPRTYSKAPHAPAHRQLLKHPSRRNPASRTALLRADIRAAPWDPTETSEATIGHPFPAHPRPLPCPPRKKRTHGKARPPACGAIFPRPAAYCAFGVMSF